MTETYSMHHVRFKQALQWLEELSYCVLASKKEEILDSIREFAIRKEIITQKQFEYVERIKRETKLY